jgi:FkbM family methyltransferase
MTAPGYVAQSRFFHSDEKAHLEALLFRDSNNKALLEAYFDLLFEMSRTNFGVLYCAMPDVRTPVAFRAHTSDLYNMQQVFLRQEYGFEILPAPTRILDLGAYCGYAALYFANKYENSRIICVEPSDANFAILTMNTVHYPAIRCIRGAVWKSASNLALTSRTGGHWGSTFAEAQCGTSEAVRAYTVLELLNTAGWATADFIKIDIEGAELEVFSDPFAGRWIADTSCISVETHDRFKPGALAAVQKAISAHQFDCNQSGEFLVFKSRHALTRADPTFAAEPILLGAGSLRPIALDLVNVSRAGWGIQAINDETWQLHPNIPGSGPAEVRVKVSLEGYRRFSSTCHLAGTGLYPVLFSVRLEAAGVPMAQASVEVSPGNSRRLELSLPAKCHHDSMLILATEMASGALGNGNAWAQWIRPMLA